VSRLFENCQSALQNIKEGYDKLNLEWTKHKMPNK
jgi:hypothetical protein